MSSKSRIKKRIVKANKIIATISIHDSFSLSYIQIDLHWLLDDDMENRIEKCFFLIIQAGFIDSKYRGI